MSICRFSSNRFQCDVYCYESESGYVIHVASRRHIKPSPVMPDYTKKVSKEAMAKYQKAYKRWSDSEMKEIGLPNDGQSFEGLTAGDCYTTLVELKEMGYLVPDDAIETMLEEAKNEG